MERNQANLTRKGSNIVKKLWLATFQVTWVIFVGYNSDKKSLVILPLPHTTDHKTIQDGSWVCLPHEMALQRAHFDNSHKNVFEQLCGLHE